MEVLFGILVGLVLAFIYVKWKDMSKPVEAPKPTQGGGGGYTGTTNNVFGEKPKDNVK